VFVFVLDLYPMLSVSLEFALGDVQRFVLFNVFAFWVPFRVVLSTEISAENDVRFFFAHVCLWAGSFLVYIICVCLHIVVSNTCRLYE